MTIDGPYAGDPTPIRFGLAEIGDLRRQLLAHTDDPVTKVCALCGEQRCRPWRAAYTVLVAAGVKV